MAVRLLATFVMLFLTDAMELTQSNWDAETAGKNVFAKFFAPWCGHCKKMKPDWEKLMRQYQGSSIVGVYDVDCTGAGKSICQQAGVRGYPAILYGDPSNIAGLQKYNGGRTFDALSRFAGVNLVGDKSAGKDPAPAPPSVPKGGPAPKGKGQRAAQRAGKKAPGKRPPPARAKMGFPAGKSGIRTPSAFGSKAAQDRRGKEAALRQARQAAAKAREGAAPMRKSPKSNQQRVEAQRRAAEKKRQAEARRQSAVAARKQQQEKARAANSKLKNNEL